MVKHEIALASFGVRFGSAGITWRGVGLIDRYDIDDDDLEARLSELPDAVFYKRDQSDVRPRDAQHIFTRIRIVAAGVRIRELKVLSVCVPFLDLLGRNWWIVQEGIGQGVFALRTVRTSDVAHDDLRPPYDLESIEHEGRLSRPARANEGDDRVTLLV